MTESFAELFEQSINQVNLQPGAIVIGTVVDITDDFVVVNAGLKSEGISPPSNATPTTAQTGVSFSRRKSSSDA